VSRVPGLLQDAVVKALEALRRVAAEGARAGVNTAAVCAPPLRQAFFEAFTTFAVAMDKVRWFGMLLILRAAPNLSTRSARKNVGSGASTCVHQRCSSSEALAVEDAEAACMR